MSRPKIVAVTETFNEERFIERWLAAVEGLVDEILVIDDGSTDRTPDLVSAHPKVTELIRKNRGKRTEVKDFNRLFGMAMDHGAEWIMLLAADEVFDIRMRDRIDELVTREDVGEYRFRKYWLWRSEDQIRMDRPEKFAQWNPERLVRAHRGLQWRYPDGSAWKRLAKVAIGHTRWKPQYGNRGLTNTGGIEYVDDVVIVHFAAVDWNDLVKKHIRYALGEREEHPYRNPDEIAEWAAALLDEATLELAPVPPEWSLGEVTRASRGEKKLAKT